MLQIAIRTFGAALFPDKYLATQALLKEPCAGDVICMDVGIEGVEKFKPQFLNQRRFTAYLLEYGIDEYRLMAFVIAKQISVSAGLRIK